VFVKAAGFKRSLRVAQQIRAELMDIVLRGALDDSEAAGLFVSHVRVSDDLQHADVYVRLSKLEPTAAEQKKAVQSLQRLASTLRYELASRLRTKFIPKLKFHWDNDWDTATAVEGVLRELKSDDL